MLHLAISHSKSTGACRRRLVCAGTVRLLCALAVCFVVLRPENIEQFLSLTGAGSSQGALFDLVLSPANETTQMPGEKATFLSSLVEVVSSPASTSHDAQRVSTTQSKKQNRNVSIPHEYPSDTIADVGFISSMPREFFQDLQRQIDEDDNVERCRRYGYDYTAHRIMPELRDNARVLPPKEKQRRIFFGALAASEPWELYEIVGAETYGIFEAMVFVEANLTQMVKPRNFTHLYDADVFADIYGVPASRVQVRPFLNENPFATGLDREHLQREEILLGWKELGMTPDDIGYLADADETFTRDFLRALQVCDRIPELDYSFHRCHPDLHGVRAEALVFETSPECATQGRIWFHPEVYTGACIEGIGNETVHPRALRKPNSFLRLERNGDRGNFPLSNAADLRHIGAARDAEVRGDLVAAKQYDIYTGFHLHNFFVRPGSIRWKYFSYGHVSLETLLRFPFRSHCD
jgi:Glycosyltransferase family 17